MLKIGIFGVGHMGTVHVQLLQELSSDFEIVGFFDPSDTAANRIQQQFGIKRFFDVNELIDLCDCIDIVAPTSQHFELASSAIRRSKHVFIEKPVTQTVEQAKKLLQLASEASVQVQVGYVERFNPAFIGALPHIERPMHIEMHRLAPFSARGTDVSVILDLMIHDLDIVLSVVKSTVKRVVANGVAVMSSTPDMANARIEFDNGCVATITVSRISKTNVRKAQFFQRNASITVDFLEKEVEIIHQATALQALEKTIPFNIEKPVISSSNAMREELHSFAKAIRSNSTPVVSIEDACRSMELAATITERLNVNAVRVPNRTIRSAF
ncbi:MAG: oxidoreductase [Candidatus Fluviicola riflensis]|nr:MAG: oxidoreductase [Candidatus Fluviicola riflensis]OGS78975.1 MAG: oxidoreductase [Candidatus Fluviicola riflensis]OGS85997.1 MAG: oxidoreductase [Fluviicola sp. RIFCSPHIGHO2_12_FULL_43_24]OGS86406.1 MAG: oxidoreductase [Fluviicola sp. RIFCSPHIGHO2_01_FULL_43_53]